MGQSGRPQSLQSRIPKIGFSDLVHFAVFQNIQGDFCPQSEGIYKGLAIRENTDLPLGFHIGVEELPLLLVQRIGQRIAGLDYRIQRPAVLAVSLEAPFSRPYIADIK